MELTPLKTAELTPPLNVTVIRDVAGLEKLRDFFTRCFVCGWDIETDPKKDYFWRRIRTIQFGNQHEQYVIDLLPFFGSAETLFKTQGYYGVNLPESLQPVIQTIAPVLCSRDYLKVGVNLGFEYTNFYWLLGMRTWNFFDCSMVERCIWAGAHSLKDYGFYSMEDMMARYFQVQIDKSLQESFTLDQELTDEQYAYAALDVRFPLPLRQVQQLLLDGETYQSLKSKGNPAAKFLKDIEPILTGDNLVEIAQIENDAIGAFQDMHIHGERLDREKWIKRIAGRRLEMKRVLTEELDPFFIPIVGRKTDNVSEEQVAVAEELWKSFRLIPEVETKLKAEARLYKKTDPAKAAVLELERLASEAARKEEKEKHKKVCSDLKKRRTAIKNLAEMCEGTALINYASGAQVLDIFQGVKGLSGMKDTEDDTLAKFAHVPAVAAYRTYRGLAKEIKTYGEQWAQEWVTKPCKEEGWLHPGDGRLHCTFNQYQAETGRSTSEQPNGQNLPREEEVRACFIADPPDENIRISLCCEHESGYIVDHDKGISSHICLKCYKLCETKPEEYVIITADMSGAELRILAELADEPVWVSAFGRDEDVHCVCTEIVDQAKWEQVALPECAYFQLRPDGTAKHKKCKCPEHNKLRNDMKPTNFGIPYGISAAGLSVQIGKSMDETTELLNKHRQKFPRLWAYIEKSGLNAKVTKKAFDMYGRRRVFLEPTWERAKERAKEDREEQLRLPAEEQERNKANFIAKYGRKPTREELWFLKHRLPSNKEVASSFKGMHGSIERQGKNHPIQSANASIAKKSMGCGFCPEGKPYLWHTLPQYKVKLLKMVHDELVVQSPKRYAELVAALIGDAFKRAAAEKMHRVSMEFSFEIDSHWKKG